MIGTRREKEKDENVRYIVAAKASNDDQYDHPPNRPTPVTKATPPSQPHSSVTTRDRKAPLPKSNCKCTKEISQVPSPLLITKALHEYPAHSFLVVNFMLYLTSPSGFFSSFDRSTYSLSVSHPYLALEGTYLLLGPHSQTARLVEHGPHKSKKPRHFYTGL